MGCAERAYHNIFRPFFSNLKDCCNQSNVNLSAKYQQNYMCDTTLSPSFLQGIQFLTLCYYTIKYKRWMVVDACKSLGNNISLNIVRVAIKFGIFTFQRMLNNTAYEILKSKFCRITRAY